MSRGSVRHRTPVSDTRLRWRLGSGVRHPLLRRHDDGAGVVCDFGVTEVTTHPFVVVQRVRDGEPHGRGLAMDAEGAARARTACPYDSATARSTRAPAASAGPRPPPRAASCRPRSCASDLDLSDQARRFDAFFYGVHQPPDFLVVNAAGRDFPLPTREPPPTRLAAIPAAARNDARPCVAAAGGETVRIWRLRCRGGGPPRSARWQLRRRPGLQQQVMRTAETLLLAGFQVVGVDRWGKVLVIQLLRVHRRASRRDARAPERVRVFTVPSGMPEELGHLALGHTAPVGKRDRLALAGRQLLEGAMHAPRRPRTARPGRAGRDRGVGSPGMSEGVSPRRRPWGRRRRSARPCRATVRQVLDRAVTTSPSARPT